MPNHVKNTIEIYCWDGEGIIDQIREMIRGDGEHIDFETIIPPPENMFRGDLSTEDRKRCAEEGIPNWYDWQSDNWGTKWNAYEQELIEADDERLVIEFSTAWAPPTPVIEELRRILTEKFDNRAWVSGMWVEEGYQSAGVF